MASVTVGKIIHTKSVHIRNFADGNLLRKRAIEIVKESCTENNQNSRNQLTVKLMATLTRKKSS